MGEERRKKQSLDDSYRYYRGLEQAGHPDLYKLVKSLQTVTAVLRFPANGHFKLSKPLWRRIWKALFDTLITSFPGHVIVVDEDDNGVQPDLPFPEEGWITFYPDGCKRADDHFQTEIKDLYPGTREYLAKAWQNTGAIITPEIFADPGASFAGYFIKHADIGDELLGEESSLGQQQAHIEWAELREQVSSSEDPAERQRLLDCIKELESVWGSLSD